VPRWARLQVVERHPGADPSELPAEEVSFDHDEETIGAPAFCGDRGRWWCGCLARAGSDAAKEPLPILPPARDRGGEATAGTRIHAGGLDKLQLGVHLLRSYVDARPLLVSVWQLI
jgi:hypothetical protein